jgi:hypothetical protein
MNTGQQSEQTEHGAGISRRAALMRGGASGAAAAVLGTLGFRQRALAQEMTPIAAPAGWTAKHVEVSLIPHDPVNITLAGSGPPQRGDHFYIDAPIYARGDEAGAEIGIYRCFGVWIAAADATDAPAQRLTTVQYVLFNDGIIFGIVNEAGADPNIHIGAVQGGNGPYAGAIGTFNQSSRTGTPVGVATPGGTPAPGPNVVDATFDLLLPGQG